ncbi:helicase [Polaribacter pectinis]|uniref:Helicase n=1 Tax=Polaribacter pectinis TaxID=2738844 RepID=A0A7G9L6A2_9FLAO|nr:helicase-related protein [Polaribacter pectinis]QNM84151.1 helicase [Polaribacter pectinis]
MSIINEKRESLERFIKEQTLGPGINGFRFIDVENEDFQKTKIDKLKPIDYTNEIIDIVPAAVYSTGILFPQDNSKTCNEGITLDNNEGNEDEENKSEESSTQNTSTDNIEETDTIALDQMFPKTMGVTCCLDNRFLGNENLEIKLNARYYSKLKRKKDNGFNKKYAVNCELSFEKINQFIEKHELKNFHLKEVNGNLYLLINYLSSEEISQLKARIREIQKEITEEIFSEHKPAFSNNRFLTKEKRNLSSLKSTIFNDLKYKITDVKQRKTLYDISQKIEILENTISHFVDLLEVNGGGFGLWRSKLIERIISIKKINFPKDKNKVSFLYKDLNEDFIVSDIDGNIISKGLTDVYQNEINKEDGNASLSLNLQLSRDTRNFKNSNKIFVKVQLINTSTPFTQEKDSSRYYSTFNEKVNEKCFFGVKLSITNKHLIPYNELSLDTSKMEYSEDETTDYIYRQFEDFGIGHGCSVKWDKNLNTIESEYIPICDTPDVDPTPRNKSKALVKDKKGNYKNPLFLENSKAQQFKWLSTFSDAKNEEVISGLNAFVDAYGNWIKDKRKRVNDQEKKIANQELKKCSLDYQRMKENINTLLSNEINIESFRLMNSAMFMQIWHSVNTKKNKVLPLMEDVSFSNFNTDFYKKASDKLFSETESTSWRAFQLAFILLNLDGIFKNEDDINWEKRNEYVDLVWFPTGGGKTEAYLGLIALTIINRRKLHKERGGGTAAIMRYTLRLLTLQQFQRATLMIMALELIRRWDVSILGKEPINIGLWVGNNSIPNKLTYRVNDKNKDSLQYEFEKLNDIKGKENKVPFNECPWCNSKIIGDTIPDKTDDIYNKNRLHLKCSNKKCSFSFGRLLSRRRQDQGPIPVNLCDETIYQHPPSLLFGTVDKFAQLAHKVSNLDTARNRDSRRLFGRGNWENGKPTDGYFPPDIIIQDELHLLNGPLGSSVALFESAVDQLCTRIDGTRPKVISSTATTRNTGLQIAALFDRKVNLFPKQGVECDDSFFSFYKRSFSSNDKEDFIYESKRRYIGILPTGRTQIWMQMRLAAITMTHRALFELQQLGNSETIDFEKYNSFEEAMDYFHTIISYFNSLKEVGKTQSQVQSYILKEVRRVFNRVIRPQKLLHSLYTYGPIEESELTGRLSGEEVKNELKKVEEKWDASLRFAHIKNAEIKRGNIPPEFLVATNMISVGIDVSRFNLIIMNSMPRNTAEYIQASSRVARDSYGLVLTVHHPFRARDISHYEKFIEFHEKMYSYVEPISITPFTSKSVSRYLGLYLATMLRHTTDFVERVSASNICDISDSDVSDIISQLTANFDSRIIKNKIYDKEIQNLLKPQNIDFIKSWIEEAFKEWRIEASKTLADNKTFVFSNKSKRTNANQEQLYVDLDAYEADIHSKKWQIPMSLRVIESEAAIKINSK